MELLPLKCIVGLGKGGGVGRGKDFFRKKKIIEALFLSKLLEVALLVNSRATLKINPLSC